MRGEKNADFTEVTCTLGKNTRGVSDISDDTALPKKQSQAYKILELIAVLGEVPTRQIKRLAGGERYKELVLIELRKSKLIYTFYQDKLRGLRLTGKAKDLLIDACPDRFEFFLIGSTETNIIKSEFKRRLRLHRVAQAFITMLNSDVSMMRDEKPNVFSPMANSTEIVYPSFYLSREVKELGARATAIRGSRSVGILLTASAAFAVYNMGEALMKWDYRAEMRVKTLMVTLLCHERESSRYAADSVRGLVLADTMEMAYQLMSLTGEAKRNFFILDGSFDRFHFVTNDHAGENVIRILCDDELDAELRSVLSADLFTRSAGSMFENDALDANGQPVLFAYTFDMPRIARFNSALILHACRGTIICFDFQAEVLRRYCCDLVTIQAVDLKMFERNFLDEN